MAIRLLLIIAIMTTLFSCKREHRVVKDTYPNGQQKVVNIYPDCNDTSLYKVQFFYENGQLASEGFFKDGKKNGHFKSWYENGQLESDWNVLDGKENGFIQCWYTNGQKKKEGTLSNGIDNGQQTLWYENGKQKSEGQFINGKKQGIW